MMQPKIVFFGTSDFAVAILNALQASGYIPSLIVTTPDRPTGRKGLITPPPLKKFIVDSNSKIPVIQPNKLSSLTESEHQHLYKDFDLFIVVDYGKIIPQEILDIPIHGSVNVHVSLLPALRGASPMQTAILNGVKRTGVTIMEVVKGLDEGRIIDSKEIDLDSWNPTFSELSDISSKIGADLLIKNIPLILSEKATYVPQDHLNASYTRKFETKDGYINPDSITGNASPEVVGQAERIVRALNPNPGAWTEIETNRGLVRLKILSAKIENTKLVPIKVIPAGKNEMSWQDFLHGTKLS